MKPSICARKIQYGKWHTSSVNEVGAGHIGLPHATDISLGFTVFIKINKKMY